MNQPDLIVDGKAYDYKEASGLILPTHLIPDAEPEEKPVFLQPDNRQYRRKQERTRNKLVQQLASAEFRAQIKVTKENRDPTMLPTHTIHKILRINKIGRHRKGRVQQRYAPNIKAFKLLRKKHFDYIRVRRELDYQGHYANRAA